MSIGLKCIEIIRATNECMYIITRQQKPFPDFPPSKTSSFRTLRCLLPTTIRNYTDPNHCHYTIRRYTDPNHCHYTIRRYTDPNHCHYTVRRYIDTTVRCFVMKWFHWFYITALKGILYQVFCMYMLGGDSTARPEIQR